MISTSDRLLVLAAFTLYPPKLAKQSRSITLVAANYSWHAMADRAGPHQVSLVGEAALALPHTDQSDSTPAIAANGERSNSAGQSMKVFKSLQHSPND
jgi:hypothetical protein